MSDVSNILITGATAGLGRATARVLAASPHHRVVIAARDPESARAIARAIGVRAPQPPLVAPLDLASLGSVRALPSALDAIGVHHVDALVCNAGVQDVRGLQRTAEGFERTFAVNHLAHMGLACELLPRMRLGGRIVFVASDTHDPDTRTGMPAPRWDDVAELARGVELGGDPVLAGRVRYTTSKLCNVLCARRLARALAAAPSPRLRSLRVAAFDPGMMPGTSLAREYGGFIRFLWSYVLPVLVLVRRNVNTVRTSAKRLSSVVLDTDAGWLSGAYISRGVQVQPSMWAREDDRADQLWAGSARLLGGAGIDVERAFL